MKILGLNSLTTLLLLCCLSNSLFAQTPIPDAGEIFRDDVVPRIDIFIDQDSLNELLRSENLGSDYHYSTTVIFDNKNVRDTIEKVGFRLRGNTSRGADKKSFKLSMNTYVSGRKYRGLEKLNLNGEHNDPSIIRSKLSWDILRKIGIPAPRANHVGVYINEEYFGLYINVEHIDEQFTKLRFGNDEGNLFRCTYPATLDFLGYEAELYKEEAWGKRFYELKNNLTLDDYSDFANLVSVWNNANPPSFPCEIEQVFNVDTYLKVMAFDILSSNWDGPIFNKNNFFLYHNLATDKFEYIPFDLDNTFGIDWFIEDLAERDIYNWKPSNEKRIIYTRFLDDPVYRKRFSYYMKQIASEIFNAEKLNPYLDAKKELITRFIIEDPFRGLDYGWSIADFQDSYEESIGGHVKYGLKPYIAERSASALAQVEKVNIEPIIRNLQTSIPVPHQAISFNAAIEDDSTIMEVQLCYQINEEKALFCQSMFDDGQHKDGAANDGIYGISIDGFSETTTLSYYIQATDITDLTARQPICTTQQIQVVSNESSLFLNEIMAKNDATIADEAGEFNDWIELYNAGAAPISLDGFYLSDDATRPNKWALPDTSISSQSFLLIWADEDQEQGALHTNFKLSSAGETLGLYQASEDGFIPIDAINFEAQASDVSFGKIPDGVGEWQALSPSPVASNVLVSTNDLVNALPKISISPNPSSGYLAITAQAELETVVTVRISNLLGQEVFNGVLDKLAGATLVWNNYALAKGAYFVSFASGKQILDVQKVLLD